VYPVIRPARIDAASPRQRGYDDIKVNSQTGMYSANTGLIRESGFHRKAALHFQPTPIMNTIHRPTFSGRISFKQPQRRRFISGGCGRSFVVLLVTVALGGLAVPRIAAADTVDVAAYRIASAVAEGVASVLRDAPQDERALVMIGNRLDDVVVKSIQQTPEISRAIVEEVATRHPLSAETKAYIADDLVGFSQICEDFPPATDREIDPTLLALIIAFRDGVKAGVETVQHTSES
jgi:hypothetical protein